jgi:hypothetical protein
MLMAVKLMDVIVPPTAGSMRITLEECPATLINKVVFFSQICDHCDIFAACPASQKAQLSFARSLWTRGNLINPSLGPKKGIDVRAKGGQRMSDRSYCSAMVLRCEHRARQIRKTA